MKSDFFKNSLKTRVVHCPGLGFDVTLRAMSANARDLFEQRYVKLKQIEPGVIENIRAHFLIHHIVDDNGALMFDNSDVGQLGESLSAADADLLFVACQELSGFSNNDIEEIKKN